MDSRNSNPPCMRVLTRPPTPTPTPAPGPTSASSSSPDPQPSSQSHPRSLEGVVVVGFLSRSPDHSTHLINRILDSNAFGSGHLDKTLFVDKEEIKDWFKKRKISYYHEEEKGLLFLQFCSIRCPIIHGFSNSGLEELEFEELQGLLFMFSVTPPFPVVLASCPVIQFAASCLPPSVSDREQKLQFSLGCQVVLPPESFLTLKLPFVYGVQLVDGNPVPLNAFECQPEMTAWIMRGTALQVVSKASKLREGHQK